MIRRSSGTVGSPLAQGAAMWYDRSDRSQSDGGMTMAKRIPIALTVAAVLVAVVFGALWQSAARDDGDLVAVARSGAIEAHTRFSDFREYGEGSDYWGGVAALHTFRAACTLLLEDSDRAADRTFCDEIYGALLVTPERAQEHIDALIDTLEPLTKDVRDRAGWQRMAALRDALAH